MPFDLAAYLTRIRLPEAPAADAAGLRTLQFAHRLNIPFENLDVILGRPILIDSDAVFDKLVTRSRGGYCFEHDRLFGDALEALGFEARPLAARVWLGIDGPPPPRTHTFSLVTIDGQEWIADAGFGGSYCPPMRLIDGETGEAPDGAAFRIGRDPVHGWILERNGHPGFTDGRGSGEGWQTQYSFTTEPAFPADLMLSNHWIWTAPESRFRQKCIVSLILPNGFASLTDRTYRRRAGDREAGGEIEDPRVYRMRLSLMFGIHLSAEDVAGLGLFAPA